MPIKGEMYPGTDYPKYREIFESLDELIRQVESLDEGLNFVVSWVDMCRDCALVEDQLLFAPDEPSSFHLLIFMPRRSETTEFQVEFPLGSEYPHAQVDNWVMGYVRPRVNRWYGWGSDED